LGANPTSTIQLYAFRVARVLFDKVYKTQLGDSEKEVQGELSELFAVLFKSLDDFGISTDCKAAVVRAVSVGLARFGNVYTNEYNEFMKRIVSRLNDKIVPQAVLRSVSEFAQSPVSLPLGNSLDAILGAATPFLRQKDPALRRQCAKSICALMQRCGAEPAAKHFPAMAQAIHETHPISTKDMKLSEAMLALMSGFFGAKVSGDVHASVTNILQTQVRDVLASPLLEGDCLEALKMLLHAYQKQGTGKTHAKVVQTFLNVLGPEVHDKCFDNVAQVVAALTSELGQADMMKVVTDFSKKITGAGARTALLCLGETGSLTSLKAKKGLEGDILKVLSTTDDSKIRFAAAIALGSLCSGDLETYVPVLVKSLQNNGDLRYYLTCSLRRLLVVCSTTESKLAKLGGYMGALVPLLFDSADSEEESNRMVVGECLGRLTTVKDELLKEVIDKTVGGKSPNSRATCAIGLQTAIELKSTDVLFGAGIADDIFDALEESLQKQPDSEIVVQTALMNCIHLMLTTKPELVEGDLERIEALVYPKTAVNKNLYKIIPVGHLKHIIDDGLPLRQAAFRMMNALQMRLWHLNLDDYFKAVATGFYDENEDCQRTAFDILCSITEKRTNFVLNYLTGMKGAMTKGVKLQMKKIKLPGADGERAKDHTRVILKYFFRVHDAVPESGMVTAKGFCNFFIAISRTKALKEFVDEINASRQK